MDVIEKKGVEETPIIFCDPNNSNFLRGFELYGWKPDPNLSIDENYMDLVMLLTRSSYCKQGGMACVLVNHDNNTILSAVTNGPIFSEHDSDVHAEVAAIGAAARRGTSTEHATAYITMPPCKRCFAALVVSGIDRIITRLKPPKLIEEAAKRHNIQLVALGGISEQMARINSLIYGDPNGKKKKKDVEQQQDLFPKRMKETAETQN